MPLDGTPRSLPLVIFTPPGRVDLCRQTGQISPTDAGVTLGAPVTICTGSSLPTSSWQIFRWSESWVIDNLEDLAGHNVVDLRAEVVDLLDLGAGHSQLGIILLRGDAVHIGIIRKPR